MFKINSPLKFATSILLSFTLMACGSDKTIEVSQPKENQSLDEYISSQKFSGAVLVAKSGEVLLSKGYGYANRADKVDNTPDTVFRIGSVTKQFTALSLLILEERGQLTLDDPLSLYLPEFPNSEEITLTNLLNMTSGIPNYTALSGFSVYKHNELTPIEIIEKFQDEPLEFTPGSQLKYSNSNYVLAGYVIEKVSGKTYADFIENEIFDKLGMTNSSYGKDKIGYDNFAQGYGNDKAVKEISMSVPFAAGALVSSVTDLYKWHKGLKDRALISEASTQKMYTIGLNGYALGWNVRTNSEGEAYYQHGGGIDGFISYLLRSEETNRFVVVLANEEEFPSGKLVEHIMGFVDAN